MDWFKRKSTPKMDENDGLSCNFFLEPISKHSGVSEKMYITILLKSRFLNGTMVHTMVNMLTSLFSLLIIPEYSGSAPDSDGFRPFMAGSGAKTNRRNSELWGGSRCFKPFSSLI
jgi:hypothetical protein